MITKLPEDTDWLSLAEQRNWLNRFTSQNDDIDNSRQGIAASSFHQFLDEAVYDFVSRLPPRHNTASLPEDKEKELFRIFDIDGDGLISENEFSILCKDWLHKIYNHRSALVIVDVQNDFIDGSLALINGPAGQDGADVVPIVNNLLEVNKFDLVVYTQDWHPTNHIGFFDNLHLRKHTLNKSVGVEKLEEPQIQVEKKSSPTLTVDNDSGKQFENNNNTKSNVRVKRLISEAKVFDTVFFNDGRMAQKLWPTHCIQNSWGAELHPKLKILHDSVRIKKGTLPDVDAYSAFWDNMRLNETGLRNELMSRDISDVFFCGLALEYCVSSSALDSVRSGFMTYVLRDACRGIELDAMRSSESAMKNSGIMLIESSSLASCCVSRHTLPTGEFDKNLMMEIILRRGWMLDKTKTTTTALK